MQVLLPDAVLSNSHRADCVDTQIICAVFVVVADAVALLQVHWPR
jgi:hypothetical protein